MGTIMDWKKKGYEVEFELLKSSNNHSLLFEVSYLHPETGDEFKHDLEFNLENMYIPEIENTHNIKMKDCYYLQLIKPLFNVGGYVSNLRKLIIKSYA